MTKIHHALWGYSNGHHLLASSISLSNQSLKILGPLSDLSGPAVLNGFDGYLTGCFIPEENLYALSKTWYAPEMPRLGCVWTHTLFLDCNNSDDINQIDLDSLFQRPCGLEKKWKNFYATPIKIDDIHRKMSVPTDIQDVAYCLQSLLTRHTEPVVAISEDNVTLNVALEYLLGNMGLDFFRDFKFCTGSFSNREVNRVPLDLQIIPTSVTKASFRSKQSKIFFLDISKYLCTHNLNAACVAKKKAPRIRKFILSCGTQYYNYKDWFVFERIYETLIHYENFSVTNTLNLLKERFNSKNDITNVMGKVFEAVFLPSSTLQKEPSVLFSTLFDFLSTSDPLFGEELFVSEELLKSVLDKMWRLSRESMVSILPRLIEQGLNTAGEEAVRYCAMLLMPNDFSMILRQAPYLCTLFLQLNWRLALCKDIWIQSKSIQEESLYELRQIMAVNDSAPRECADIIRGLYQNSQYSFSKEAYETFGDISIAVFFEYFESLEVRDGSKLQQWSDICKFNQAFSIQKLKCVQNPGVFQAAISELDPYTNDALTEPANLWNVFYQRFCFRTESEKLRKTYAEFILPIILCTKDPFEIECVEFAFLTVHKVLIDNDMEHFKWERLSELLPKVEWFNEWDKCKRLRMAAEDRGYRFDFNIN